MSVRIGAVSYLNTKPLIYGLRKRLPQCELRLDLPSRLADQLNADLLDVALIPCVEYFRGIDEFPNSQQHPVQGDLARRPSLSIVTDACIACCGPVRSVRVLFRKPPRQVRTLAIDEGSRTSAVLAQVLLAQRFSLRPKLQLLNIAAPVHTVDADAVLVIGDRAMKFESGKWVDHWDLGEEWTRDTGLPFVFAMWVTNTAALPADVVSALQQSRDEGLANVDTIAELESPKYGLSVDDCRDYFLEQLHFTLGPRELAGLELFRQLAVERQLLPPASQQLSLEPI